MWHNAHSDELIGRFGSARCLNGADSPQHGVATEGMLVINVDVAGESAAGQFDYGWEIDGEECMRSSQGGRATLRSALLTARGSSTGA